MGKAYDGIIDANEFKNISEEKYNAKIKEMKAYYKKATGRDIEYHIPTYTELKNMLENDASVYGVYKNKTFTYGNKITSDEILEPIRPDGVIGQTQQADSGDCWQNASDIALSMTKAGRNYIKQAIKATPTGYYVTLRGAKDKAGNKKPVIYFFSKKELKTAQELYVYNKNGEKLKKYPYGDADMVLFDMAIERYRKNSGHKLQSRNSASQKGYDDYLSSGCGWEALSLITGKRAGCRLFQREIKPADAAQNAASGKREYQPLPEYDKKVMQCLSWFQSGQIAGATCSFINKDWDWSPSGSFKKYNLYEAHAYAIKEVNLAKNYVVIANPHNGKYIDIKIPLADFKKFVASIDYVIT